MNAVILPSEDDGENAYIVNSTITLFNNIIQIDISCITRLDNDNDDDDDGVDDDGGVGDGDDDDDDDDDW